MRARLKALSPAETSLYIESRLAAAGFGSRAPLFTQEAVALIAEFSQGVPRLINHLCFNALMRGCALKRSTISGVIVREVAAELDLVSPQDEAIASARVEEVPPRGQAEVVADEETPAPAHPGRRMAAVAAILLVVCGTLYEGRAHWGTRVAAKANVVSVPSPAPSKAPPALTGAVPVEGRQTERALPDAGPAAASSATVKPVKVGRGQTLRGICAEHYGNCDQRLLMWIRSLNPRLGDLDHIQPGQTVLLPVLGTVQKASAKRGNVAN